VFYCNLSLRRGTSVDNVLVELDRAIERLRTGLGEVELTRAKMTWRARWLGEGQDLLTRTQRLTEWYVYSRGRTDYVEGTLAPHQAIDGASLRRAATRWLAPEVRVVVTTPGPTESKR
jgi:hypothetical protein